MNIEQLEQEIERTNGILDHIEEKKNLDISFTKNVAGFKTVLFTNRKIALERELFAQKIVKLCLTGR